MDDIAAGLNGASSTPSQPADQGNSSPQVPATSSPLLQPQPVGLPVDDLVAKPAPTLSVDPTSVPMPPAPVAQTVTPDAPLAATPPVATSFGVPASSSTPVSNPAPVSATPSATDAADDVLDQDILKIMGADTLPEAEKNDLYRRLFAVLQNRALIAIDDTLAPADLEGWKQAIDTGDAEKMDEFLASKGIDFKKLLLSEALKLKMELADLAKASYQAPTAATTPPTAA